MIYMRLEGEAPPVVLQEFSHDFPTGVLREVAMNLWGLDDAQPWELVSDNGRGLVMGDDDRPAAEYGVLAEDVLLLRPGRKS
jgi:hypothetical protein